MANKFSSEASPHMKANPGIYHGVYQTLIGLLKKMFVSSERDRTQINSFSVSE